MIRRLLLASLLLTLAPACGDDGGGSSSTGSGGGTGTGSGGSAAVTGSGGATSSGTGSGGDASPAGCSEPTAVPCEDDVILAMNLQDDIAPGDVSSTPEGAGFVSLIDATAGGPFTPDPDSYVYARFTDGGLEKVEINDEDSVASMDWDIAFRRYVVRINSGHSGPSCVSAARVVGATYDEVTSVPSGSTFRQDTYFTESCELIPDGTGLEGSPATALSSYWTYPGCVQMTDQAFVVSLADGRALKLLVTHFYNEETQAQCQEDGEVGMENTGSGNFRVRWAFL